MWISYQYDMHILKYKEMDVTCTTRMEEWCDFDRHVTNVRRYMHALHYNMQCILFTRTYSPYQTRDQTQLPWQIYEILVIAVQSS